MEYTFLEILGYFILPILGSMIYFFILFYAMYKMGCNKYPRKLVLWAVLGTYMVVAIGLSLLGNGIINLCLLVIFIPLIGNKLFHNNRTYLIYYILLSVVTFLLDAFMMSLCSWMIMKGLLYFSNAIYYNILYIIVSKFITFIVAKIFIRIVQRREKFDLTKGQYFGTLFLPAFSIIYLYTLIFLMQIYAGPEEIALFVCNILLILLLNVYFTRMLEVMNKNNKLQNELNLYSQQEKIQYQYYEELERKYEESRKIIHDIRNHMLALEKLYESSEGASAHDYANEIHNKLNKLGQTYYSPNKMLNIIMNDKTQIMESNGITFEAKIGFLTWDFIRKIDLTTIFGNLLDNAIEASKEAEKKEITFNADKVRDFVSITISNTMKTIPKKNEVRFLTTKKEHQGLGLKNVERVVKAYQGDIQYEYDMERFTVRIMIPVGGE